MTEDKSFYVKNIIVIRIAMTYKNVRMYKVSCFEKFSKSGKKGVKIVTKIKTTISIGNRCQRVVNPYIQRVSHCNSNLSSFISKFIVLFCGKIIYKYKKN